MLKTSSSIMKNQDQRGLQREMVHRVGNPAIDIGQMTAFFCSVSCPGRLILNSYDLAKKWCEVGQPVIGGFHAPVEREVLRILLRSTAPICVVVAHGLPKQIPSEFKKPIDDGRMILASPFDGRTKRATAESALKRNLIISVLAEKVFVAYAAPGSKTETLCHTISKWKKPLYTFDHPANVALLQAGAKAINLGKTFGRGDNSWMLEN